jgi:DNA-binding NarL/FixJ family response regulator
MYIESVQQELELHPPSNIINKEKRETLRNLYESGYEEDVIADQLDLALSTVRALIKDEMHLLKH